MRKGHRYLWHFISAVIAICSTVILPSCATVDGSSGSPNLKYRVEAGRVTINSNHNAQYKIYYVRADGGTASQCNGLYDISHVASDGSQNCAVNHPFGLFSPSSPKDKNRIQIFGGGDTMIISPGEYMFGYGAPNTIGKTNSCVSNWSYDCVMPSIPSGPDQKHPTRILGRNWDTKTTPPPQLYGVGRAIHVLNLSGSKNVEIRYLELTDHSSCIYNSPDPAKRCDRSTIPRGDQADYGISAADSSNVLIKDVNIHGFSIGGIKAGRLADWSLENVIIRGNGFVGWNGDVGAGKSSNSGNITFKNVKIEFNGCGEKYPSGEIYGCFSQSQGGYGDGLGTHSTGGDWLFDGVEISHNTSDGLDLLYHNGNGTITIKRSRFEGNAGNAVKIATNAQIENSIMISNCDYFDANPQAEQGEDPTYFTQAGFDSCRAAGTALVSAGWKPGRWLTLTNSLITGTSTILIEAKGDTCDGSEKFISRNNIFVGMEGWFKKNHGEPGLASNLFYLDGSDGNGAGPCGPKNPATAIKFDNRDSVAYNIRYPSCSSKFNVLCADPMLSEIPALSGANHIYQYGERWNVVPKRGGPVAGKTSLLPNTLVFKDISVPDADIEGKPRPFDGLVDWGPYQIR